jgi:hypothetical protein
VTQRPLRPKRHVLSCGGRRGTILPRVMSHERQLSPGGGAQLGPILAILGCLWIIKDLRIPTILVS